ncbi:hypothetical protein WHR41_08001 [Cladosporium halotolerans]|uniref:Arrestin-like N-terminal domain-containing protein n=1 Tax=Cladosporium halotolerans TaxID=1052096 RepID=A0AB34KJL6_9PEZI
MSAGSVWGKIVLDNPAKYHCGPNDPVTGHVALTYRPRGYHRDVADLQSLFGPLIIYVTFYGRAKTKIHKSNGNTSSTYRGRAPLFEQRIKIHEGPYSSKPGECVEFPFAFNFPEATQPMPNPGDFRPDRRFHEEHGGPLPPTFTGGGIGFTKSTKAFVEYRLTATANMPGIDVDIHGFGRDDHSPEVLYEQPRLPLSRLQSPEAQQFCNSIILQNENLLPESDRPTGFRQKTKFLFSSEQYPTYVFDIMVTAPSDIYMGQPLTFELSVHPNFNRCNAPLPPEIRLRWLRVELRGETEFRAEYGLLSAPESSTTERIPPLATMILDPEVPFCKANDHTKTVRTRDTVVNIGSSFTTYNISRQYTLRIEYCIFAAGKENHCKKVLPVRVLSPLDDGTTMLRTQPGAPVPQVAESSSSAAARMSRESENAAAPQITAETLPHYEQPPGYDQALESRTENDLPVDSKGGKGKA